MYASSLRELRQIMNESGPGTNVSDNSEIQTLIESITRELMLDEAYFGKGEVAEIEKVMCRIEAKIKANPFVDLYNEPESRDLDTAICKTFGFKNAHVYWARNPDISKSNPFTIPAARILGAGDEDLAYGSFKKGFYDKKHKLTVFIQMDNNLVTYCHMTGPEMTAILLHEIGHNFDYTPFKIFKAFFDVINAILDYLDTKDPRDLAVPALQLALSGTVSGRKLLMEILNLEDTVGKLLPPVGLVLYAYHGVKSIIRKVKDIIHTPMAFVNVLPMVLVNMPLRYLFNFFLRKSETYADSFAAVYGYGPELTTALIKLDKAFGSFTNLPLGPFHIFESLSIVYDEIATLAKGGHGTTQQRTARMLDALRREVEDPALDPATKKEILAEIYRLQTTYDRLIKLDGDMSMILSKMVNQVVNCWYEGTNFNFISILLPEYTYAK